MAKDNVVMVPIEVLEAIVKDTRKQLSEEIVAFAILPMELLDEDDITITWGLAIIPGDYIQEKFEVSLEEENKHVN